MAWPNPFRRRTANTRTCWGYTFELTEQHMTAEEMHPLKYTYDKLGEECLELLDSIGPVTSKSALPRNSSSSSKNASAGLQGEQKLLNTPPRDLYVLLRDNAGRDSKLQELWDEVNTVPDWVDWAQIERGQDVFYRYGGAALTGLAYQSLLGGMGAARVVETLARTGGFSAKAARRRLFETTQHILQCTRSLAAIQPGGEGWASSIRVRFLHAAVRRRILALAAQRPDYYSVERLGVPISDLDCIATVGSFSAALLWLSFPRQGLFLSAAEIDDYTALWRWIGHVLGTPTEPYLASAARAKATMESLLLHEIAPTQTSCLLAANVIRSLDDQPPGYASADMLVAGARWLNGNELCDRLALPRPSAYYWALVAGQCLFFMSICYFYRSFHALDRKKIAALKRIFYAVIVESKYGLQGAETLFDFKYVPELSMVSADGHAADGDGDEDWNRKKKEMAGSRYVESRNLKWLVLGATTLGLSSWCAVKIASLCWSFIT